jgi:flagellar motor switch protein FliN
MPQLEMEREQMASGTLLEGLELPVEVRLGRLVWTLGRVLELRVGDAVPVGPDGDDTVVLYVQGRPYAMGDLVVVDGRFAFRVREICAGDGGTR